MKRNAAVIFDACVLYQAPLRDLLLEIAGHGFRLQFFRAKWTDAIHDEWISNLLKQRQDIKKSALERTRKLMDANVPECLSA